MAYIYSLINPLTDLVFYVGYTKNKPAIRLLGHVTQQKLKNIVELTASNLIPIITVLEEGEHVTLETENKWIRKLHKDGCVLENISGLLSYEERGYIIKAPTQLLNNIGLTDIDKLKGCLQLILDELPLSSSIPIVQRIKNICDWGLSNS